LTGATLPQTFQAGIATSKEIEDLTLTLGDINRTTLRDYFHNQSQHTLRYSRARPLLVRLLLDR